MALNKNFYAPTKTVTWGGETVGTFSGLSANDLALLMVEQGRDLEELIKTIEGDNAVRELDPSNPDAISAFVKANASNLLLSMLQKVPLLAAKIIAVSAGEPDQAEVIQTYPAPLQVELLTQIAVLTFVDMNGFKQFLGNVTALVAKLGSSGQRVLESPAKSSPNETVTAG